MIPLSNQRQQFTSGLTALVAMAGAAIGLGNVWRFPYMMATHGGSAYFLVYLLCVVFLAVPALVAPLVFGWCIDRAAALGQLGPGDPTLLRRLLYRWTTTVVPLVFAVILVGVVWDSVTGQ